MSLKGFTKAVARLPHLVMAKAGYSAETVDAEFNDLDERFKLLDTGARKLCEEAKKHKDALSSLLGHQESFAQTLLEVYLPISSHVVPAGGNPDDVPQPSGSRRSSKTYRETDAQSLRAAEQFAHFATTVRADLTPDLTAIERSLVAPAVDLVALLDNVKRMIVKRSHKLIDYDRHRETVKKLKEKERTVSEEKSLGKAEVAFDQASREYNGINNQLKSEIPVLLSLKSAFIDPCFQTLYFYQLRMHSTLMSAYQSLVSEKVFDQSVGAAVGFETKVAAQSALLDVLTIPKNIRRPSETSGTVSPTAGGSVVSPTKSLPAYTAQPVSQPALFKQLHGSYAPPPPVSPYGQSTQEEAGAEYVTALYDYTAQADGDLSFQRDDRIEVLEKTDNRNDWWTGRLRGVTGIFPGNYVD